MAVLKFIVKHANILLNSWQYVFFFEINKQKEETYRWVKSNRLPLIYRVILLNFIANLTKINSLTIMTILIRMRETHTQE